jgi:NAD(P)H-nitrite reductase large subunit
MSNSAPVLGVASNAEFIRDRDETALSPALTVSGADGATLAWASVVITDGFRPGDHLAADTGGTRTRRTTMLIPVC